MRFIRVRAIITPPPTGTQPPARLVPAPRGRNGTLELVARLDDRDDLLGGGREDDDVGLVLLDGVAVALVDGQVRGGGEDVVGADDGLHPRDELRVIAGRERSGAGGGGVHGGSVAGEAARALFVVLRQSLQIEHLHDSILVANYERVAPSGVTSIL